MHAGAKRKLLYCLCVSAGDNLLANASGLYSLSDAQPYNNLQVFKVGHYVILTIYYRWLFLNQSQ